MEPIATVAPPYKASKEVKEEDMRKITLTTTTTLTILKTVMTKDIEVRQRLLLRDKKVGEILESQGHLLLDVKSRKPSKEIPTCARSNCPCISNK